MTAVVFELGGSDPATGRRTRPDVRRPERESVVGSGAFESYTSSVLHAWQAACDRDVGHPVTIAFAAERHLVRLVVRAVAGHPGTTSGLGPLLRPDVVPSASMLGAAVAQLARLRDTVWACVVDDLADAGTEGAQVRLNRCFDALCLEVMAEVTVQLEQAALIDFVTDLPNRRAFDRDLPGEMSAGNRYHRVTTLVAIEMVRSPRGLCHGGPTDDGLRLRVAQCLSEAVRSGDRVYWLGDEQFAVLLRDASHHSVDRVMTRVVGLGAPAFDWGAACTLRDGHEPLSFLASARCRLDEQRLIGCGVAD